MSYFLPLLLLLVEVELFGVGGGVENRDGVTPVPENGDVVLASVVNPLFTSFSSDITRQRGVSLGTDLLPKSR